mgnify:CR=1 FL=1
MSRKMTLLEMVQNILSALESDEVNSIGDTVEALQVAEEVKTAFDDLFTNYEWPSEEGMIRLNPSLDPDRPTVMTIPDDVEEISSIHYNTGTIEQPRYVEVRYQEPSLFFRYGTLYVQRSEPIRLVDNFYVYTNQHPRFWTTFDNNTIVFDGFNSDVDTTLQASKILCIGRRTKRFELTDDFVPPIDNSQFPLLLSEAKRMCFVNYKGVSNANEERRNRNQRIRSQKFHWRTRNQRPRHGVDYGRRRR